MRMLVTAPLRIPVGTILCRARLLDGAIITEVGPLGTTRISSVQSLSRVQLFATPWTSARQASLSFTISQSLLKLISIELVLPFKHLILCHPLLLLPLIFPRIRVFSNERALRISVAKVLEFQFQHQTFQ